MKKLFYILIILIIIAVIIYARWSTLINFMLPKDTRPAAITFPVEKLTPEGFEKTAKQLQGKYDDYFSHIDIFRENKIFAYEGPQTCLNCHETIAIKDATTGDTIKLNLMDNLTSSSHYRFYTTSHKNVYGFNGVVADHFEMGKINRPCPKPGSFAMTSWAAHVYTEGGDTLSEGCGQCHIGGEYAAPLGEMMPGYRPLDVEKKSIDCLICHSVAYDMNRKTVVQDANGRFRWDQDRSMKAAMAVTTPTAQACLRCHQHNMAGDIIIDSANPSFHQYALDRGYKYPRIAHPGSKRGTPFNPQWDVHARAGFACIDCHTTKGHYIAKGTHTTTMMSNDLPNVDVSCVKCHETTPHTSNPDLNDFLNSHTEKIACITCHIPSLDKDNATYRDFAKPTFEEELGIWVYTDIVKEWEPGIGITYVWWNGDASFLGNPIGDNPNGENLYSFYQPTNVWPEFKDFDYKSWYESKMRPIAKNGRPSKIYPMKVFNGRQHIDLQNMGPFGGMYLPYNLPTYYRTGNPDEAAKVEMQNSMMKRMYGWMFKYYMMDKFMHFMDVDTWNTKAYNDAKDLKKVEARWLPQDASLEMSHAIRKEGALSCNNCHSENGVMDFKKLGYDNDQIDLLKAISY